MLKNTKKRQLSRTTVRRWVGKKRRVKNLPTRKPQLQS